MELLDYSSPFYQSCLSTVKHDDLTIRETYSTLLNIWFNSKSIYLNGLYHFCVIFTLFTFVFDWLIWWFKNQLNELIRWLAPKQIFRFSLLSCWTNNSTQSDATELSLQLTERFARELMSEFINLLLSSFLRLFLIAFVSRRKSSSQISSQVL